ncbi:MAG: nucleoside deaminase [Candidatus Dojkabacteria bacterium]|jgi:guanine deaminase
MELKKTDKYMLEAINEAYKGIKQGHGGPFGAVLVQKGKIVAKAHNTVLRDNDATCHAEMHVIRNGSKKLKRFDLSDCELYTTGKPCPMCKSAIQWAKIKNVYYGCDYNDAKAIGFVEKAGNSKSYKEKKICSKECKELYSEYKKLKLPRY